MDELKALHEAGKNTKVGGRLLVYMARLRGGSLCKIADDFGNMYSTIRDWLLRAGGGLDWLRGTMRPGPRADWMPRSWQKSGRIS